MQCRGRDVAWVREDVMLDVVFKEFMSSNNHMLLVRRAPDMRGGPDGEVIGLITLEDVMEELIQVCSSNHLLRVADAFEGRTHWDIHFISQPFSKVQSCMALMRF